MNSPTLIFRTLVALTVVALVALGVRVLLSEPISHWAFLSMSGSLAVLLLAAIAAIVKPASFYSQLAALYATILIGRLFGTMHVGDSATAALAANDVLLVAETGPGQPIMIALCYCLAAVLMVGLARTAYQDIRASADVTARNASANDWALTFIRCYVGLMFIAHYSGHILAGPVQFKVFADYFSGVGVGIGAPMVILAGLIELAVSIGLGFGFMTRLASVGAALYLFLSTLWGAHFEAGYIWVLPMGGWEFPVFWLAVVLVFAVVGGGRISLDTVIRRRMGKLPGALAHTM